MVNGGDGSAATITRAPGNAGAARRPPAAGASTVFQEQWWLQAAAGSDLQQVQVTWGGQEVACLSFVIRKQYGFRTLRMPPYTRTLGPVLSLPAGQHAQRMSHVYRVTKEIVAKLPDHDKFWQIFDPDSDTAFSFSLCGFNVTAEYTFRIPRDYDVQLLWKNLDGRRRKLILERGRTLSVETHANLDRFETMARQEYSDSISAYDHVIVQRLFEAARDRGQAVILAAVNEHGRDVVNAIIVWGSGTAYFWLATRDQQHAGRGAKSLIAWHAVKLALEKGLAFDFDSYVSLSGARFVSTFGVPPVVRPVVTSRTALVGLASACKAAISPFVRRGGP
jgi:hypothetical protein